MALVKNKTPKSGLKVSEGSKWRKYLNYNYLQKYVLDPSCITPACFLLFIFEIALNIFIIERVNYTEIDWIAYMQEVEGFLNGTFDYQELKGDTGPLVYPAGFVYIYSLFYYITDYGKEIHLAQYIFMGLYLVQMLLLFRIYKKTAKVPPYAIVLVTLTSYRIHSIYVLRLFNDPIATLLFYIALNLWISDRWMLGSAFYSLAVSVKMNILLYAPCLLTAYLTNLSLLKTGLNLAICAGIQLFLGAPFLLTNPLSYIWGSFDLSRVFNHQWTVNYRFLPVEVFENRFFHIFLLVVHIGLLLLFLPVMKRYLCSYAKLHYVIAQVKGQLKSERRKRQLGKKAANVGLKKDQINYIEAFEKQLRDNAKQKGDLGPQTIDDVLDIEDNERLDAKMSKVTQLFVLPFFVTNLIGIMCARSLHYQFYSWYFHSLLYLAFASGFRKPVAFLLLGLIEYCWNCYPSTILSSCLLHGCHFVLFFGVYTTMKL